VSRGAALSVLHYVKIKTLPCGSAVSVRVLCTYAHSRSRTERIACCARCGVCQERCAQAHEEAGGGAARTVSGVCDRVCTTSEQAGGRTRVTLARNHVRASRSRQWTRLYSKSASTSNWLSIVSSRWSPMSCCASGVWRDWHRTCCCSAVCHVQCTHVSVLMRTHARARVCRHHVGMQCAS
jgi:hypothetical protein